MPNPHPPAEQERERCPDCGSDDPKTRRYQCDDSFHSQVEDTEQKGGGADGTPPVDTTSGPGMKPLSEDEGRDL